MAVQYSVQKMVSDGTLSTIALGIQYLQRNDIYMRIAGEETPQSGAPSGYTWSFINNTTLKILPVVPNGVEVVVHRRTDVDAMYNIYSQNAQFDEATIDENNQQLLYIAQEYLEQGLPGAGVDTIEYVRDDGSFTYYRMRRTDGSYSEEFTVPSASNSTKVLTRESLRRSYAEAGYNLVDGSFEAGGMLVNSNDVLLQERTGKAFSGPAGTVAAGTDPAVVGSVYTPRTDVSLRSALKEFDGLLSANPGWDDIPSHSDPGLGAELNAQAKALMSRTEKLNVRVNGRNDVDGNWMKAISDIEVAYNRLGATLDGNILHRVDFTAGQTDTQSRLLYALQNIPSGHVFERFVAFGSIYTTMSIRPVAARVSVGKPTFRYELVSYAGNDYHTVTVSGEFVSKFRMSYYDGVLRRASEVIDYLGLRYVRLLVNASPVGSAGVNGFCTTINNGKLIQGDPNNTYFISSCFFSADGKLHVVPHKDTPVEQVVRNYYYNHDAVQAMHFRYVLVKDGAVYDLVANGYTTQVGWDGQPSGRTSIGQKANGDLVFAVIDGSTTAGTGVTVKRMSEYMLSRGCVDAMNLDGSGSSVMYYANERKNSPSDGQERQSPNFIYFL